MSLGNRASNATVNITLDAEVTAKCLGKHSICTRFPDARPLRPHFTVHSVDRHLGRMRPEARPEVPWHFTCYYLISETFQARKR